MVGVSLSLSSPFLLLILSSLLLSFFTSVSVTTATAACTQITSGHFNDPSYSSTVGFPSNQLKLTDITITTEQTVLSLGLQTAGSGDVAYSYNLRLGLYGGVVSNLTLLAQTDNIFISTAQAAESPTSIVVAVPVLQEVVITPGVYYVARIVDQEGLLLYGDGNFTDPGMNFTYVSSSTLPSQFITDFNTSEVRAEIVGCPYTTPPPATTPTPVAGATGDPQFVGFYGQSYQVHGIPNEIFNIITSTQMNINAKFIFIAEGEAMTSGEQKELWQKSSSVQDSPWSILRTALTSPNSKHQSHHQLPNTAAWTHTGSYLGEIGIQMGEETVMVWPGSYSKGFDALIVKGQTVSTPLLDEGNVQMLVQNSAGIITLLSRHVLLVQTALVSLEIVNSDHFFNIDNARLNDRTAAVNALDGILGQSADPVRYFPNYRSSSSSSQPVVKSEEKEDFEKHQILDYLVGDHKLISQDFTNNKFIQA
jgi:hypothetical protein